jgi:hypothetical protein
MQFNQLEIIYSIQNYQKPNSIGTGSSSNKSKSFVQIHRGYSTKYGPTIDVYIFSSHKVEEKFKFSTIKYSLDA